MEERRLCIPVLYSELRFFKDVAKLSIQCTHTHTVRLEPPIPGLNYYPNWIHLC